MVFIRDYYVELSAIAASLIDYLSMPNAVIGREELAQKVSENLLGI
jgi:hypothetical protein